MDVNVKKLRELSLIIINIVLPNMGTEQKFLQHFKKARQYFSIILNYPGLHCN